MNKTKLNSEKPEEAVGQCTCRDGCPVNKECKTKDTIYEAVIIDSKQNKFKYIGKSSTTFIERYRNHKKDIKHKVYQKNCELSKKAWELKDSGIEYKIEWKLRTLSKSYQPGAPFCRLCLEEVNQIIFYNEEIQILNSKNELYKKCRHKSRFKLGAGESDWCLVYISSFIHSFILLSEWLPIRHETHSVINVQLWSYSLDSKVYYIYIYIYILVGAK